MRRAAGSGPARAGVPAPTLEARAAAPPCAAARTRLARDAASAFAFVGVAHVVRLLSDHHCSTRRSGRLFFNILKASPRSFRAGEFAAALKQRCEPRLVLLRADQHIRHHLRGIIRRTRHGRDAWSTARVRDDGVNGARCTSCATRSTRPVPSSAPTTITPASWSATSSCVAVDTKLSIIRTSS